MWVRGSCVCFTPFFFLLQKYKNSYITLDNNHQSNTTLLTYFIYFLFHKKRVKMGSKNIDKCT